MAWRVEGRPGAFDVDGRLVALLRAIGDHGSLALAARAIGMPYRSAWALLDDTERALRAPVVVLTRGRGAALTPLAQRWLEAHDHARNVLASHVPPIGVTPQASDARVPAAKVLRVAASHDIALAQLKDRWRVVEGVALEFLGSAASLEAYLAGRADVAGFHLVTSDGHEDDPLLAMIDRQRDVLIRFLTREQGLIVPRGNPRRVRTIGDLAQRRITMVNRQPGSGTRLLLDRLLAREGIVASSLAGYANEEFTHAAVAATVSSGRADAGFGIRAAAAQFGLGFVPIATERYLFAGARTIARSERMKAFRALLASPSTRAVVTPLPGYALDSPGRAFAIARR